MSYKEAIHLKRKQFSTFEEGGIKYQVFVTPEDNEDFKWYLRDVRAFYCQLTDNVAKKYSRNRQFALRGLYYNRLNILYSHLNNLIFSN
jgi:hypothetical protein